jgi:hypothetical protein
VPKVLLAQELNVVTHEVPVLEQIKALFPSLTATPPLACTFSEAPINKEKINSPLRIGCVLSGGQA